jgi:hypothetical protein
MLSARRMAFMLAGVAAMACFACGAARALEFQRVPLGGSSVSVALGGPIASGDFGRLQVFLGSLPEADRVMGFELDSAGGNIYEAQEIADLIDHSGAFARVRAGAKCSSACFLLFAASHKRLAEHGARIGVHRASVPGQSDEVTTALTQAMQRDAAAYGTPRAVLDKMAETPPEQMAWLTDADLAAMGAASGKETRAHRAASGQASPRSNAIARIERRPQSIKVADAADSDRAPAAAKTPAKSSGVTVLRGSPSAAGKHQAPRVFDGHGCPAQYRAACAQRYRQARSASY